MPNNGAGIRQRIGRAFQSLFMEDSYIAWIYYESMRDNFEGYVVTHDPPAFEILRSEFNGFCSKDGKQLTLGKLFRIELALLLHLPDDAIKARFWSIEDRFRRVVPQSVIDSYNNRTPSPGDPRWDDIGFVRNQSRSLLDVIHANYLINLGREQSTKRLMFIIAAAAVVVSIIAAVLALAPLFTDEGKGLMTVAVVGMFGAMISIVNRLQKATSRDAMAQDGIFELIGLRTGWVSILMSVCMGGVFALLVYAMVIGGLSELVLPSPQPATASGNRDEAADLKPMESPAGPEAQGAEPPGSIPRPNAGAAGAAGADQPKTTGDVAGDNASSDGRSDAVAVARASAPAALAASAAAAAVKTESRRAEKAKVPDCPNPKTGKCPPPRSIAADSWAERMFRALRVANIAEFYKLLVLAFVAGFAERFVPDILNRLGKQGKPE